MLNEAEQVFLIKFVINVMLCYSATMITTCLGVSIYAASNKYLYKIIIKSLDVTKRPVNQTPIMVRFLMTKMQRLSWLCLFWIMMMWWRFLKEVSNLNPCWQDSGGYYCVKILSLWHYDVNLSSLSHPTWHITHDNHD